jgi:hypothetical protein
VTPVIGFVEAGGEIAIARGATLVWVGSLDFASEGVLTLAAAAADDTARLDVDGALAFLDADALVFVDLTAATGPFVASQVLSGATVLGGASATVADNRLDTPHRQIQRFREIVSAGHHKDHSPRKTIEVRPVPRGRFRIPDTPAERCVHHARAAGLGEGSCHGGA